MTVYVVFLTIKRLKKFYDAKLIFWSFATFFGLTIFWSGAKQRFCFSEIYYFINQSGIPYLSIISWILLLPYILKEWQILLANTILEKRLASSAYYPVSYFPVRIFLHPEFNFDPKLYYPPQRLNKVLDAYIY